MHCDKCINLDLLLLHAWKFNSIITLICYSNDDQRSLPGQDAAAGSVAPYPPLRLVPSRGQLPLHHENDGPQNVFS